MTGGHDIDTFPLRGVSVHVVCDNCKAEWHTDQYNVDQVLTDLEEEPCPAV